LIEKAGKLNTRNSFKTQLTKWQINASFHPLKLCLNLR
jgi:hypothetical protein